MRLIKENTMQYESFLSRLNKDLDKNTGMINYSPKTVFKQQPQSVIEEQILNAGSAYPNYLMKLSQFADEIHNNHDQQLLISVYKDKVTELQYCKELSLFLFDKELNLRLEYTSRKDDNKVLSELNKDLEQIFKDGKIKFLVSEIPFNKIVIPVFEGANKKGLICIETVLEKLNYSSIDFKYLTLLSNYFISHLSFLYKKRELADAYTETQHYQSKLLKDCRLSAVGELTIGISQEILSSLQVILSSIGLLETGSTHKPPMRPGLSLNQKSFTEINSVKKHVAKVDKLLKSVLKFSDINKDNKFPQQPCCLNESLNEFLELFSSSFLNNNYEIVPDLENDLPPILSSPIYLKQLFISTFGLLKSANGHGGGYLIRTRHQKEHVQLIIISTDPITLETNPENINLKVLKNLITMHEGQIELSSEMNKGTAVILNFPLKRTIC